MNEMRFEAEIARGDAVPAGIVRERRYGGVRVSAEWPVELAKPELRLAVTVTGDVDRRDAPGYVELFFHDVFLILNLAAPGSFSGTISVAGSELRVRELSLSARVFEYARGLTRVPVEQAVAWYDGLQLGTRQLAEDAVAVALFQLLHLARAEENEEQSILRLASAAEALLGRPVSLRRLFELRDQIATGRAPLFHPLHDDALDPRITDATREWIEVADDAASTVIAALQNQIRSTV